MSIPVKSLAALSDFVVAADRKKGRKLVAMAGAPGSGKSTLAVHLARALKQRGCIVQVVPMDGFHLDNRILKPLGLLDRKGAPETFDVMGFKRLISALGAEAPVYYPLFDRTRDIAIAGAGGLEKDCDTVIVEGNYLLLNDAHWRDLCDYWDVRINLSVPEPVLRQRLIDRWLAEGLGANEAEARAEGNDLKNARRVMSEMLPCDVVFQNDGLID